MSDHNPIVQIQKLGIPVNSYIVAAQTAGDLRRTCDAIKYNELIAKVTGGPKPDHELPMAQSVFGYLVQEHVRNFIGTNDLKGDEIERLAFTRAQKLVKECPWLWSVDSDEESETSKITNREEALRIMKALPAGTDRSEVVKLIVERLEVTATTAQSYIRDAVKTDDVVVAAASKEVKVNKKAAALEMVRENPTLTKKEMIQLISTKLDTTTAGAQTYYYSAIKVLGVAPPTATKKVNTKALVATLFDQNPDITKMEFLEQAEIQFNVQVSTAQTYYYAIIKDRQATA